MTGAVAFSLGRHETQRFCAALAGAASDAKRSNVSMDSLDATGSAGSYLTSSVFARFVTAHGNDRGGGDASIPRAGLSACTLAGREAFTARAALAVRGNLFDLADLARVHRSRRRHSWRERSVPIALLAPRAIRADRSRPISVRRRCRRHSTSSRRKRGRNSSVYTRSSAARRSHQTRTYARHRRRADYGAASSASSARSSPRLC